MGLCVVVAWVFITLVYAPLLVLDERFCKKLRFGNDATIRKIKLKFFGHLVHVLHRRRRLFMLVSLVGSLLMVGIALPMLEPGRGIPNVFPDDHNRNRGQDVLLAFPKKSTSFRSSLLAPRIREQLCTGAFKNPTDNRVMRVVPCIGVRSTGPRFSRKPPAVAVATVGHSLATGAVALCR